MGVAIIVVLDEITDPAGLEAYAAEARAILERSSGTLIAGPAVLETLEGKALPSAVMINFPDYEAARTWYFSDEYQKVAKMRHAASAGHGFFVETVI